MSDQEQTDTTQSDENDESIETQDMEEVAGGGCMTFIDTAGCSSSGGGGGGGGGGTGGSGKH
jgi:hypothetical protein